MARGRFISVRVLNKVMLHAFKVNGPISLVFVTILYMKYEFFDIFVGIMTSFNLFASVEYYFMLII